MQRQLRLGDILDDYCPRERRVTNHAVVAMMGSDVKQTRCTTCDTEHEYKQARVPRQRRKSDTPAALYAAVVANGPKRVVHGREPAKEAGKEMGSSEPNEPHGGDAAATERAAVQAKAVADPPDPSIAAQPDDSEREEAPDPVVAEEDGPVHRPLIRASLPRPEGTPPPQRPAPDFTIRQPGGRPSSRFRPRHQRGGQPFHNQNNRGNGNMGGGLARGGMPRSNSGRPPGGGSPSQLSRRQGPGRKRSK